MRRFIVAYGWRAYALPVLTIITVAAVLQMAHKPLARQTAQALSVPAAFPSSSSAASAETIPAPPASATASPSPRPLEIAENPDSTECLGNTHSTFVLVSISQQHAWMCAGRVQVNSTAVTTGETINDDATPTGSWVVQDKQTNRYLVGPGYKDFVKYWIPFNGDFGFHDASWQTFPFGSPMYRSQGSHGCVHLPLAVVTWLYGWAQPGSTVVTIEA